VLWLGAYETDLWTIIDWRLRKIGIDDSSRLVTSPSTAGSAVCAAFLSSKIGLYCQCVLSCSQAHLFVVIKMGIEPDFTTFVALSGLMRSDGPANRRSDLSTCSFSRGSSI